MPTYAFPHLLLITEHNRFETLLTKTLASHELEITAHTFSEILSETFNLSSDFDYIIYNAISSHNALDFFLNRNLIDNLLLHAHKTQSRLLFLLPDRVPQDLAQRVLTMSSEISRLYPASAFLVLPDPFYEEDWQDLYSDSKTIRIPNQISSLSLAYPQDLASLVVRNLFSLKAYAHIQVVSGVTIMSDQLEYLLVRQGDTVVQSKVFPKIEIEYPLSENLKIIYSLDTFFARFVKPIKKGVSSFRLVEENNQTLFPLKKTRPNISIKNRTTSHQKKVQIKPVFKKYALHVQEVFGKVERVASRVPLPKFKKRHVLKISDIRPKRLVLAGGSFAILLVLPYILSISALFLSSYYIRQTQKSSSVFLLPLVTQYSCLSETISQLYVSIEKISYIYRDSLALGRVSVRISEVAKEKSKISALLDTFFKNSFSGQEFETSMYAPLLSYSYEAIYAESGFIISELDSLTWTKKLVSSFIQRDVLTRNMQGVLPLKSLANTIPEVFGIGKSKVYAVILQNDTIIRPTGGKIEALALLTVENGLVKGTESLNLIGPQASVGGVVTAPFALEKYLHESNWELVNANWDYSYPYSAEKIIWFIDKEFDRKVDGVIALSQSALSTILKESSREMSSEPEAALSAGIASFEFLMGHANLHSRNLLLEMLSKKEVLVYVPDAQSSLDQLKWSDSYDDNQCEENCFSDKAGIIESNFGEPNELVKHEADVSITFNDGVLKRQVMYYVQNNGNDNYKAYIRMVVPKNSKFLPVEIVNKKNTELKELEVFGTRGQKEGGVYIEVPKGETVGLSFFWEESASFDVSQNGSYILSLHKQPGVTDYPISLQVDFPIGHEFSTFSDEFLTNGGIFKYNTVLSKDLNPKITWRNK